MATRVGQFYPPLTSSAAGGRATSPTTSSAKARRTIRELLRSPEPAIRWRTRVGVLQEPRESPRVRALEQEVRGSARVRGLLLHEGARFR